MHLYNSNNVALPYNQQPDSHSEMSEKFAKAMAKLTTLGQDVTKLIDCTSVIPVSLPLKPSEAFESRRSETNIDARR